MQAIETETTVVSSPVRTGLADRTTRRLLVWNGLVILGLGFLLAVTWFSRPSVTWSLNPILHTVKQSQQWPGTLVQFGVVQVVELPAISSTSKESTQKTILALLLGKCESASGIYIPPEELHLTPDGSFEISLTYAPLGEGTLYFDWLKQDEIQNNVIGNPQIPFAPATPGQLLYNRMGPYSEQSVRGLGLRILTAGQIEVELIELMITDVTALQPWRSNKI